VAIAAAKAGAANVLAADIDTYATAAIAVNAGVNGVTLASTSDDVIDSIGNWDTVLIGDMCYERPLAERMLAWLHRMQVDVFLGDPRRSYFPADGVERLTIYNVRVTRDLEDREIRETGVYRLVKIA
jgi:predicted nicotinamide N-methyase